VQKHAVNDTWGQRRQVGQRVALETAVAQKIDLSQFFKLGKNPYAVSIFGEQKAILKIGMKITMY